MRAAIITVAGISSRFNVGIPEAEKKLKAIYTEGGIKDTLLYHLLIKCKYADRIIVIGGYRFEDLKRYCCELENSLQDKIALINNTHFEDLASGYSLYLGLQEAFRHNVEDILFIEGDLDVDDESFNKVQTAKQSVLTYTYEPIYANRAVVLYQDDKGRYRYAFNSCHGLLTIGSPFSCILNSGQTWKFTDIEALKGACEAFCRTSRDDTNLRIIQNYLETGVPVDLVAFKRWTNCNTKEDFRRIVAYWEIYG